MPTFNNTAWLIDGPLTEAEFARRAHYAATSGAEGITTPGDLKVIPLSTPGNGLRISPGGGTVINRYAGTAQNQSYVIANPTTDDTLNAAKMPASNPAARSHLIVAAVGDFQYSSAGHPFMPADDTGIDLDTFQYVRPVIIPNVAASTTKFSQLGLSYPALTLARIDVPANTTTITAGMIVDLRKVATPRSETFQQHVATSSNDILTVAALNTYEYWPDQSDFEIEIPEWATVCYADGFIEGFQQPTTTAVKAAMRIWCQTAGTGTTASKYADGQSGRKSVNLGGKFTIPANVRGTLQHFQIQATAQDANSQGKLTTDAWTTAMVRLRFVSEAV